MSTSVSCKPGAIPAFDPYELVRRFHLKNNLKVGDPYEVLTLQHALLRGRLILEELGELAIALHELPFNYAPVQLIPTADALSDLLYVVLGTGVTVGHWAGVGFCTPHLVLPDFSRRPQILKLITREASRVVDLLYFDAINDKHDHLELSCALHDLCSAISDAAHHLQIPLRECFYEISRSNLTKTLGDTADGRKGNQDARYKGPGYEPPDLAQFFK